LKSCPGIPIETGRLGVTQEQIIEFFREAIETIEGVPAHFVFNMDEMGHQDWADWKKQICIVPSSHPDDHVNMPVPRSGKRITLLACLGADGSFLRPGIIIPRKTVDEHVLLSGLSPEKLAVRFQPKGFVDTEIFDDWLSDVLVQELFRRRELYHYDGRIRARSLWCVANQPDGGGKYPNQAHR
jgi:hypothetical protein